MHLILGSILASLVVLLFMRDWRATVITGVAIPASIISTFGAMYALGFTMNNITMLALVLMVGVVIDDAIVVLENIYRFIEEKKMPAMRAAVEATRDIGLAVMATTLSLVVVFLPVSFMSSISGRFLFSFGLTATVAILVSLVVSFSLTPMMSSRLLTAQGLAKHADSRSGFYAWVERTYLSALGGLCATAPSSHVRLSRWWLRACRSTKSCGRSTCPPTSTRASSSCRSWRRKARRSPPCRKS
jgi:HAE1 family hydrophobic/amphiphilic exporter-1